MVIAYVDGSAKAPSLSDHTNFVSAWACVIKHGKKTTILADYVPSRTSKAGNVVTTGPIIAEYLALENCLRYLKAMGVYQFILRYDLDDFERAFSGKEVKRHRKPPMEILRERIRTYGIVPYLEYTRKNEAHRVAKRLVLKKFKEIEGMQS